MIFLHKWYQSQTIHRVRFHLVLRDCFIFAIGNLYRAMGHFPLILLTRFTLIFFLNRLSCKTQKYQLTITVDIVSNICMCFWRFTFNSWILPFNDDLVPICWKRDGLNVTHISSFRFRQSLWKQCSIINNRRINSENVCIQFALCTYKRREHTAGIHGIKKVDLNYKLKYNVFLKCISLTRSIGRVFFLN